MEIWNFHSESLHLQQLLNKIPRLLRQKR